MKKLILFLAVLFCLSYSVSALPDPDGLVVNDTFTLTDCLILLDDPATYCIVNSGTHIIEEDIYYSLYSGWESAIVINSSNVVIDCNFSTLLDNTEWGGDFIHGDYVSNVTVKNCNVYDFYSAIEFWGSNNTDILNNVFSVKYESIYMDESDDTLIHDNLFNSLVCLGEGWCDDVYISDSLNTIISENDFESDYDEFHQYSIYCAGSDNLLISSNSFTSNNNDTIYLLECTNVTIEDNTYEIDGYGNVNGTIYSVFNEAGAGIGIFIQTIAVPVGLLLLILVLVGMIAVIGTSIAGIFKKM